MAKDNSCQESSKRVYDMSMDLTDEGTKVDLVDDATIITDQEESTRSETNGPMLCILSIGRENIVLQQDNEEDAVLIDDRRLPSNEDTVIDLSIDSKALKLLSVFLFITLQRIPRHYSKDGLKARLLLVVQVIAVLLLFSSNLYELGVFGNNTLTVNQMDTTVTSVKNILSNLRFPVLYVVGIFYFRTRHFEKLLSEVRLTRRYWKHGRKVIMIAITMMFLFSVLLPVICKVIQMSLHTKSSPSEDYSLASIISNCLLYIIVRAMSLSIVFAFVVVIYLIYCQIRLFKEQILKCPRDCKTYVRDAFVNIKRMIKYAERYFQPFLVVHLSIFLALLIPIIVSSVEQYEVEGSFTRTFASASKLEDPSILLTTTAIIPTTTSSNTLHEAAPVNNTGTQTKLDKTSSKRSWQEKFTDYIGIIRIILGIVVVFFEMLSLYSLPIILLGKVDKCIKSIRYDIEMLKFSEQIEGTYMFQSQEDVNYWKSVTDGARGIQIMGMSLTSFKAVLISLLFPFVTVMFRIMLRHVNINP